MTNAKVKLSNSELLMVCDAQLILTKNSIINKVYLLFGALSENFLMHIKSSQQLLPKEVFALSPKIYRGENYQGLPYVTLDYPRYFSKKNLFAIRCFFWWGNFFSITLHLAGDYAKDYASYVTQALKKNNSWYVCINHDQWQHHFNTDNYLPVDGNVILQFNQNLELQVPFIKIAKKIPLHQWNDAYDFFVSVYEEMMGIIKEKCGNF